MSIEIDFSHIYINVLFRSVEFFYVSMVFIHSTKSFCDETQNTVFNETSTILSITTGFIDSFLVESVCVCVLDMNKTHKI